MFCFYIYIIYPPTWVFFYIFSLALKLYYFFSSWETILKNYGFSGERRLWGITQIHQLMPPIKYTELERVWKFWFFLFFWFVCCLSKFFYCGKRISNKMYFLLFYYWGKGNCSMFYFFYLRYFIGITILSEKSNNSI